MSLTIKAAHDVLDKAKVWKKDGTYPQLVGRIKMLIRERDRLKAEIKRLEVDAACTTDFPILTTAPLTSAELAAWDEALINAGRATREKQT